MQVQIIKVIATHQPMQRPSHKVYDGMLVIQERDTNNAPLVTYTRGNDLSGSPQDAGGIGGLPLWFGLGLANRCRITLKNVRGDFECLFWRFI